MNCTAPEATEVAACEVRLTLPYPPSANTYWKPSKGRGLVPSDEAERYKAAVAHVAARAKVQPLFGPVRLTVTVYRPKRMGDLDNTLKVLNDALNGVAWLDDEQVVHIDATRDDDKPSPRAEVLATAARFATPEEAAAHRRAKAERAAKARRTRNKNRAAKARLRLPKSLADLASAASYKRGDR
ncbi:MULTISPECIES: RusA family crossover junction endodeoxyribonuclease [Myxococcus]|uniref:RusA family crossover junction endodeoxyribonuclease n=1 Tax=Myxococcus TaxID=32 RepID=UPI00138FB58E|nr:MULTISPECIES: RusA family crossover junction endodeoxyribonuclease [Myxococcus]NOK06678.1 RusA family crossover junction endodeoxyribonuclease [Myxococcus xanthus]